jgi:AcrR family transcriptional regulator
LEKGYEAVTIRDITARADVGYATFFRHYPDKDALLADVLDVILEELIGLIQRRATGDDEATGRLIFTYVAEHGELCRVLLDSRGSSALMRRMRVLGARRVLAENAPRADSPVPPEIAANHLVAASIALIQWWLENDMPLSPARMGAIYHALIAGPTQAIAFAP